MLKQAFVLAAGKGERLKPLTDKTPKPLIAVRGRPLLELVLNQLIPLVEDLGLQTVVVNAWHLKSQIIRYVEEKKNLFPFELRVSDEAELLGTGGGLKQAFENGLKKDQPLLMLNGDCVFEGDLSGFCRRGLNDREAVARWWLSAAEADQTVIGVEGQRIRRIGSLWRDETTASGLESNREGCFTGIQIFREMDASLLPTKGCIIRDYWIPQLKSGRRLGGDFEGLREWTDAGTPERLKSL